MFTADLSWTGPDTEKVGERRERKARERSITAASIKTSSSSRNSSYVDRELWWTSGLKKAKGIRSNILRPSSHRSSSSDTTIARPNPKKLEIQVPHSLRDPTLQPAWTYETTLSPTLPSGASFDLPVHDVPELEGDTSSRHTNSTEPRFSHERRWEVKTPIKMDSFGDACGQQRKSSLPFIGHKTRASSMATDFEDMEPRRHIPKGLNQSPDSAEIDGTLNFGPLGLQDDLVELPVVLEAKHLPFETIRSEARRIESSPMSQWECLSARRAPGELHVAAKPVTKVAIAHSSTLELTRFQRFIRRMESAGPRIVLDRLKEEWDEPPDTTIDEELALEKQLWLLTGFQMQSFGKARIIPKPSCDTGRILELYGNLAEVFQTSAMYPHQIVHFLTNKSRQPITLPANVSYLTVRDCGAVPLPYPDNYFSHIRASTLPSLVPSSNLPDLFRECYKLLAPGGLLEVRIMDASPVRKTAGPLLRMWIEDRLSTNLERLFRCSKPCLLVPSWLAEAGFELEAPGGSRIVNLPCTLDTSSTGVDKELSTVIGRSLWRDIWGSFVDEVPGEPKWWWEDEDIMQECRERQTVFECQAIFACKSGATHG